MKNILTNVNKYMKTKMLLTIIVIVILLTNCQTKKVSILGNYKSNCLQEIDYIHINTDSTYTIKYSLGNVCDGKLKMIKDTLFLMDNWKEENLKKNDFLFDKNDEIYLGKENVNRLNREIIKANQHIRFIIKENKLIEIDTTKSNNNCVLRKVK